MGCTAVLILLPWLSNWGQRFYFFEILAFNAFILEKWSVANGNANDKCLQPVQVTSMTYVCSHPIWYNVFRTMLYNCIYEIIQCCSPPLSTLSTKVYNVAKNSTSYSTRLIGRILVHVYSGLWCYNQLPHWLPPYLSTAPLLTAPLTILLNCFEWNLIIISLSLSLSLSLCMWRPVFVFPRGICP